MPLSYSTLLNANPSFLTASSILQATQQQQQITSTTTGGHGTGGSGSGSGRSHEVQGEGITTASAGVQGGEGTTSTTTTTNSSSTQSQQPLPVTIIPPFLLNNVQQLPILFEYYENYFENQYYNDHLNTTLPNEIKRLCEHIHSLDTIANNQLKLLKQYQQSYLQCIENKILQLQIIPFKKQQHKQKQKDSKKNTKKKKKSYHHQQNEILHDNNDTKQQQQQQQQQNQENENKNVVVEKEEEQVTTTTTTNMKRKRSSSSDNNNHEDITTHDHHNNDNDENNEYDDDDDDSNDDETTNININDRKNNNQSIVYGVRVLDDHNHTQDTDPKVGEIEEEDDTDTDDDDDDVVIPTTEELMEYIMMDENENDDNININNHNNINNDDTCDTTNFDSSLLQKTTRSSLRSMYEKIQSLQIECQQKADEKIIVAQQIYHIITVYIQRLHLDLHTIDLLMKATREVLLGNNGMGTTGNQSTGAGGSILSGLAGAGGSSTINLTGSSSGLATNMTPSASLLDLTTVGGGAGGGGSGSGSTRQQHTTTSTAAAAMVGSVAALPNDLAACQLTTESEWILSKVLTYEKGMYTLSDEDTESDKIFHLNESQVIILPANPSRSVDYRVSKGDIVFAIYPDTTSFYKATVVQVPRKQSNLNSLNQYVLVNFVDDSDEYGITHDKAVPLKYMMPPPPGS